MKITTFNPMILTANPEETVKLFESIGFEKRHAPTVDTGKSMVTSYRMKDANGFCIDVAGVRSLSQDRTIIRMNVDDFDEAYEMLTKMGFKRPDTASKDAVETASSKSAMMVSPSGFAFDLVQHIKD